MNSNIYQIKLSNNLYSIVLGEKKVLSKGTIIAENISEDDLSNIKFPMEVANYGNGFKVYAEKTDCLIERL